MEPQAFKLGHNRATGPKKLSVFLINGQKSLLINLILKKMQWSGILKEFTLLHSTVPLQTNEALELAQTEYTTIYIKKIKNKK